MTYETSAQVNNCRDEVIKDNGNELEATSLGEFLRTLALGLGAVVLTSIAIYFAVALVIGLGLSALN